MPGDGATVVSSGPRAWRQESSPSVPLVLNAPAKINLSLRVLRRRPDGYHELCTRMQKLELGDRIELALGRTPGVTCRCSSRDLPVDQRNIAVRAARCFLQAAGRTEDSGVELHLTKRVPVAAGLGGGSSDAAAVLLGLNSLLDQPFSGDELRVLAQHLGADVPFFVHEVPAAMATGIGEKLMEAPGLQGYQVLLVNPGFAVSTRDVFENYALTTTKKESRIPGLLTDNGGLFHLEMLFNDLEQVTISRYPVIASIKEALLAAGAAGTLMTGSGPTVFGLFSEQLYPKELLIKVADRIAAEFPGRVFLTRTVAGASPSGKAPGFDPGIS